MGIAALGGKGSSKETRSKETRSTGKPSNGAWTAEQYANHGDFLERVANISKGVGTHDFNLSEGAKDNQLVRDSTRAANDLKIRETEANANHIREQSAADNHLQRTMVLKGSTGKVKSFDNKGTVEFHAPTARTRTPKAETTTDHRVGQQFAGKVPEHPGPAPAPAIRDKKTGKMGPNPAYGAHKEKMTAYNNAVGKSTPSA